MKAPLTRSARQVETTRMLGICTMWTTEQVAQLKDRIAAGLSCAQIARELGVSRNAVIGKANRMGLSRLKSMTAGSRHDRTTTAWRARGCAPQDRQPAPDCPGTTEQGAASDRRSAGQQRPHLLAARAAAGTLSLADKRPRRRGLRFLRESTGQRPALLCGPCPHGVSAGHARELAPSRARRADANLRAPALRRRGHPHQARPSTGRAV